jgi:hypothetical protein
MISKRTAILKQVVNGALRGDQKATQILLRLLSQGDSTFPVALRPQFKRLNHVRDGASGTQVASQRYSAAQRTTAREVDSSRSR